jgi:hypothetical protein
MLPDNKLREPRLARLRVFPGAEHAHARQVDASRAYAGAHMAAVAPTDVRPRDANSTGIALFGVDGSTITATWQAWALRDAIINNTAS